MKTIIAGSRDQGDYALLRFIVRQSGFPISEVVSGRCELGTHTFTTKEGIKVFGVDGLGERWAQDHSVPVAPVPASWKEYGKAAGPMRNRQMAEYADALILMWDGKSKGSRSMKKEWLRFHNSQKLFEMITV